MKEDNLVQIPGENTDSSALSLLLTFSIKLISPAWVLVESMQRTNQLFGFFQDSNKLCWRQLSEH